MKKLIAVVSALFLFPFTALALTPMQDNQMSGVTGQAGVSIALDTHVALHVDTVAWGDSDGVDYDFDGDGTVEAGVEGWVGVSDLNAKFFVGLRSDTAANGGSFDPANFEVLTIDVGSTPVYNTYGANPGVDPVAYVRIGLGTFEVNGNMDMDFELGTANTLGQELGTLDIQGMVIRGGQGGYVDITTEGRSSGVTLVTNVLLDQINIASLAWGDSDGIDNIYGDALNGTNPNTSVGYVGLSGLDIDNLNVQGKVGIDVVTLDAGAIYTTLAPANYKELVLYKLTGLMAANPGDLSATQVILSLGDADGDVSLWDANGNYLNTNDDTALNITMGSLAATAAIGSDVNMANNAELGKIYMAGARVAVDGLVSISAH